MRLLQACRIALIVLAFAPAALGTTIGLYSFDDPGAANGVAATAADSVRDSSAGPIHGDPASGPVYRTDTPFGTGTSLDFTGGGVVEIDGSADGKFDVTGALTVEAWVKLTGDQTSYHYVAVKWNSSGNGTAGYALYFIGRQAAFAISQNGSNRVDLAGPTLAIGTWYHLAGAFDPSAAEANRLRLVVTEGAGGTPSTTWMSTAFTSIFDNAIDASIGGPASGSSAVPGLNGLIDEVRISNVALSNAELGYNGPLGAPVPEPGTIAFAAVATAALARRARRSLP